MLECRRRDLLALAAFFLFFFLYFNIHALHSDSSRRLEDHISKQEEGQHGRNREHRPKQKDEDAFDARGPANETLGVSCFYKFRAMLCCPNILQIRYGLAC